MYYLVSNLYMYLNDVEKGTVKIKDFKRKM